MAKEQLLQKFAQAYEQLIETATMAAQHEVSQSQEHMQQLVLSHV